MVIAAGFQGALHLSPLGETKGARAAPKPAWEPRLASSRAEPSGYIRAPLLPPTANVASSPSVPSQALPLTQQAVVRYRVQPGDSVWSIAQRFGIDTNTIVWANDLPNASYLGVGQELEIPPVNGVIHRVKEGDTLASIAAEYGVSEEDVVAYLPDALDDPSFLTEGRELIIPGGHIEPKAREGIVTYYVQPGDTLSTISERFGVSVDTLVWANDLYNVHRLVVGQELEILPVDGVRHRVLGGETLGSIAERYRVGLDQIMAFNNIYDPNSIRAGQQLIIPGGRKLPAPAPKRVATPAPQGEPSAPLRGQAGFIWPVWGSVTQWYGAWHGGLDIAADAGTPVKAAADGWVVKKEAWSWSYGWHLVVEHNDGTRTLYAHLSGFNVDLGQDVSQGDVIGYVGSTGYSTGPHLHFEVRQGNGTINPWNQLPH